MKLVVQELTASGITQGITASKNTMIVAIRPHLYRHDFADGSLKLELYDSEDNLVASSDAVYVGDIGSATYFHGHVTFEINAYIKKDQLYTVKLVGQDGYTFNEAAYVGWVNSQALQTYSPSTVPASAYRFPFDLQVWERTEK